MARFLHPADHYDTYLQSPESRVQSLVDLQNTFRDTFHDIFRSPELLESLTVSEKSVEAYTPTIWVEIEIAWSSLFPEEYERFFLSWAKKYRDFSFEEKRIFDGVCSQLDDGILHIFEKTRDISIPAGKDAYWEFAFLPARHYSVIFEEIRLLREMWLVPRETRHALQITLGDMKANRDAYMLLTILELINGENAERMAGVNGKKYFKSTWSRRGSAGIRVRNSESDVLAYGAQEAIELRTLELPTSEEEISFLLEATQMLACIIRIKSQKTDKTPEDMIRVEGWNALIAHVCDSFEQAGLDSKTRWGNPQDNPAIWAKFSEYLQTDARQELEQTVRRDIAVLLGKS